MNWVEREFRAVNNMKGGSLNLWSATRSAIQDACESYKRHFMIEGESVECRLENGHRVVVIKSSGKGRFETVIAYDDESKKITSVPEYSSRDASSHDRATTDMHMVAKQKTFSVGADDETVFWIEGKERLENEDVSRRILKELLFGGKKLVSFDA